MVIIALGSPYWPNEYSTSVTRIKEYTPKENTREIKIFHLVRNLFINE